LNKKIALIFALICTFDGILKEKQDLKGKEKKNTFEI
jgi:hypothetical protein